MLEISLKQNASYLKETRFGQVYPPVEGHELSEASVTLLIKAVTQMKLDRYSTPKRFAFHTLQYGNIFGTCSYK